MTEHDFKGALKSLHDLNKDMGFVNPNSYYGKHCATVELALRLADKVTQEPRDLSFNAMSIFRECVKIGCDCDSCVSDAFSATIRAIIKEVSGD